MKSAVLFLLMLVAFAAGVYVVGITEGPTSWAEVALVTLGFVVWQVWKRKRRSRQADNREKLGAV
jgi:Flp pilus assembly protein TadB